MPPTRQLAAIMFTDIQGYTALMQRNEQEAVRTRDKHRRVFNSITEKYRGRVLQYYGDGTLSIFDSALDAVQCGIDLQRSFREAPAIPVRIGIHTGDIVFSEEEIIGNSVNVAARIESLAVPGSVFISEKVFDEIKNQSSVQVTRLKAFQLKNVEKPVVVYAIANAGLIVPNPADIKGKTEPIPEKQAPNRQETSHVDLLATKWYLPPPRPRMIRRPRLTGRIDDGLSGKLTLISAPAGFGKTTLVSEWIAGSDRPVAWLSLDEEDSDPARFLTYLVAALRTVAESVGKGVPEALRSATPPSPESVLTALLNEMTRLPDPVVLVLDDYHVIDAPPVDRALTFLLDHLPPQLHLILTTREDPLLPLPRLRVRGQLTELRAADLRFTSTEAAGFLKQVMGLDLPAEDVSALESRTEGWIAGLQLAALSMQRHTDTAAFIRAFTGSHHFILDYLIEEVLERQPERIRDFLLQTSILDRLCGSLSEVVTQQAEGTNTLEQLQRDNLFVLPLDDERRWYRYHHLFADVLRVYLQKEQPDQIPILHRRASEWHEHHGTPADAVRHALAAQDFERAARLVELAWPAMDSTFQLAIWLDWVKALPDEQIRSRPVLLVGYAWAWLNQGDLEAGERRLWEAEQLLGLNPDGTEPTDAQSAETVVADEEQFRFLPASIATARAYIRQACGDIDGVKQYAQRALDGLPEEDHLRRGPAAALLGLARWTGGELEAAHRALTDAMANFQQAGNLHFAISGTYGLADIRIAQGRLREAIRTYEQSLQLVEVQGKSVLRGTADLYLGLGDLYRERGDLTAADQYLSKSEELGEAAALPDWPYRRHLVRARLRIARSDLDGALDQLNEAERHFYRSPIPDARPIAAQRARLWVRQGRLAKARDWVRERGLSIDDDLHYLHEFEHLTLARLHIAGDERDPANTPFDQITAFLERLLAAAEAGERTGSVIEILLVQALAFAAQDDLSSALLPLERALALAEPEGYVRIFLDEGAPLAELLSAAIRRKIKPDYIRRLLAARGDLHPKKPDLMSTAQSLIEPLSERELEILHLISEGLSNQQISRRLFLALSTVKGHNRNIFGKLGVRRRTEAVARARELGVL